MKHIPVEGNANLVRDRDSGAIINTNNNEMNNARLRKQKNLKRIEEIDQLKNDVAEIKTMLQKILER